MATILVFGATGDQGTPLVRELVARGHKVRGATRNPDKWDTPGTEPVFADFPDADSLVEAARGVDAIAMHLPFTFDRDFARVMGTNIGRAAAEAGVGKLVFHTSSQVEPRDLGINGHDGRRDIEAALGASGVPCAFIRSTVFMDNMIRDWARPAIARDGVFAYPCAPGLRISWVALDDVAVAMANALAPEWRGPLRLGGPEALTGDEAAARLGEALGQPLTFRSLHPDEFARAMSKLVTGADDFEPGGIYDRIAEMYRWYNAQPQSPLVVPAAASAALLGRPATPLAQWAARQDWTA